MTFIKVAIFPFPSLSGDIHLRPDAAHRLDFAFSRPPSPSVVSLPPRRESQRRRRRRRLGADNEEEEEEEQNDNNDDNDDGISWQGGGRHASTTKWEKKSGE